MQRFITDVVWDAPKMLSKYHSLVNDDLGDPHGVLIFDETGFPKKGGDSAGVARQYCGSLGKVDNCQVGVFAAYASRLGYALVDKRLFLPSKWFEASYTESGENARSRQTWNLRPSLSWLRKCFKQLPKRVSCRSSM